jgi:hypothetical protein
MGIGDNVFIFLINSYHVEINLKTTNGKPKMLRNKWMIGLILVLLLVTIPGFYVIFNSPIQNKPVDVSILQENANKHARKWSTDAQLVGICGGEFFEDLKMDLHPIEDGYRLISPKDPERNDGKCYYWTFYYYSELKVKLYQFSKDVNGDTFSSGNSYHTIESAEYRNLTINNYKPSPYIARIAKNNGGEEILKEFPEANIFYYLFKNDNDRLIWTVYYSYNGSIVGSIDVDGITGNFIGYSTSLFSVSSDEYMATVDSLACTWRSDARLFKLEGIEPNLWRNTRFSVPEIEFGVIVQPDREPVDGLCPVWVYSYVSDKTLDHLKIYCWSSGRTASVVIKGLNNQYQKKYNLISNKSFINSAEAVKGIRNDSYIKKYRPFLNYNLEYSESNFNDFEINCTWKFNWFTSPDCAVCMIINPYNGTIIASLG